MKKRILFFAGMVLMAITACHSGQENVSSEKVAVIPMTLKDTTCVVEYVYPATLQGVQDVAIYPQVSGRIMEVKVVEGQYVTKGQTLFVIDEVTYRAAYDAAVAEKAVAEAQVATAELTVVSKQHLYDEGIISDYQLDLAKNQLEVAKAVLGQAEALVKKTSNELSFTRVKSMQNGYIGSLPYKVGSLVGPSIVQPLTIVSDNSSVYADFSIPETEYLSLYDEFQEEMNVHSLIESMPDLHLITGMGQRYAYAGRLYSASGMLSQETGALTLRAIFPNPNRQLLSGGACQVVFGYESTGTILIPRSAMKEVQDQMFVFKVNGDVLEQVSVRAYRYSDRMWFLLPNEDGTYPLKPGDVISSTTNRLKDGDSIEIVDKQ